MRLIDADALSELLVKTYEKAPTEKALLFVALLLKNNEQVPSVDKTIIKNRDVNKCLNCEHCCYSSMNDKGEVTIMCNLGSSCGNERPQGEWIRTALYGETCYECNKCNRHQTHITKFCPNCGADMRPKPNHLRDCENCVHHSDNGCEVWECEFKRRSE